MNEFEQMLAMIEQMLQASAGQMTPPQQNQIMQQLMQANMQMGQLDDLASIRYPCTLCKLGLGRLFRHDITHQPLPTLSYIQRSQPPSAHDPIW